MKRNFLPSFLAILGLCAACSSSPNPERNLAMDDTTSPAYSDDPQFGATVDPNKVFVTASHKETCFDWAGKISAELMISGSKITLACDFVKRQFFVKEENKPAKIFNILKGVDKVTCPEFAAAINSSQANDSTTKYEFTCERARGISNSVFATVAIIPSS